MESSNWSSSTVPGASDAAFVTNGGTAAIEENSVSVGGIFLGGDSGGTLEVTNAQVGVVDVTVDANGVLRSSGGHPCSMPRGA